MRAEIVLLLGAALWGLGWMPLAHFAGQGPAGMPLVLCTYGLLCALAVPLVLGQHRQWWSQRGALLAICVFGGWATAGLVAALSEGDVVRAMLLFYLAPIWGLLGGRLLFGERLTPSRLGALALAMLGIALTLGISHDTFRPLTASDWLALSAGFAFALNNLATRAAEQVPLTSKAVVGFIGSAALGGFFCLLQGTPLPIIETHQWLQLAGFGLFWLAAMGAAQYGFSHVEASRAAVLVVIELLVAVLTAAWFGERELGLREWLGGSLVLAAALIAARPSSTLSPTLCEAES
ncbi:DMT family transporter [Pseudomonas nicosulfuronedens]|uniref:DMT family transporter n=1 Tax=Pseudomonas nicosulfuronedens TaxID=2571105 RepID=UPI00244B6CA9|nr:DMT family transporter [Pseudomonas nicosulfuronedens]MDH1010934.1 DMT family transporter [Pseudomonas nicosulfuronedens]MDH1979457.1 DMT family transporter [Pseudomonas nicosulfuronedens]MDH2026704.1 DMT family transporter [Pseudomonas nicosulfuronedens]